MNELGCIPVDYQNGHFMNAAFQVQNRLRNEQPNCFKAIGMQPAEVAAKGESEYAAEDDDVNVFKDIAVVVGEATQIEAGFGIKSQK